jgi:hypothetical protein
MSDLQSSMGCIVPYLSGWRWHLGSLSQVAGRLSGQFPRASLDTYSLYCTWWLRLSGFYSGHIGEEFGRNEYGSLIRQAIHSALSINLAEFPTVTLLKMKCRGSLKGCTPYAIGSGKSLIWGMRRSLA